MDKFVFQIIGKAAATTAATTTTATPQRME
jgi:hypothetical protein